MFNKTNTVTNADGTTTTTVVSTGYLEDIMSVIMEIFTLLTSQPVIYFVMLGLVGASIPLVKKIIPSKRR